METTTLTYKHLAQALEDFAVEVRNAYQDRLITAGKIATGNLLNSVEVSVEQHGYRYDAILHLESYWKYVEGGRKPGKMPPVSAILEWVRAKPVLPKPAKDGKLPTPEGLAWAIAKKIKRDGIEPLPALEESVAAAVQAWSVRLAEALAQDMGEDMTLLLSKFGGFAK